ncbi:DUF1659 domain-containing protein [Vagococcus silagei]|uniref:DUF1659 domain-containing protein n=1 Tax=Vagococcus silagei TaxID=2508885 RepID=A0A4S3B8H6_9ENTE|nr:hypothetical protein [Vagococcus silagei]THB62136.1 hypothetical protein ESZ54_02710 [Vagococcus silagei]
MSANFEEKKVQLNYDNLTGEKTRKQTISNISEEATNENIISFARLLNSIAPESEPLHDLFIIESHRHTL